VSDYARGIPITIRPVPKEIFYIFCAKEFQWPPDVVDRQDAKILNVLIQMIGTYNKIKNHVKN
jgi:hypothetical protein